MVAKKKRKASAKHIAGVDYKAQYFDLVQRCKEASALKKKALKSISKDLGSLSKVICEPDPPGCSGPDPIETFAGLVLAVQYANADKKARLIKISNKIAKLFQKICDPNPPGC